MTGLTQQQLNYRIIKLEAAKRELTEELTLTNAMLSEALQLRSKHSVEASTAIVSNTTKEDV